MNETKRLDIGTIDTLFRDSNSEMSDEDDDYLLMVAEKLEDKKEVETMCDEKEDVFFILADEQYQEHSNT